MFSKFQALFLQLNGPSKLLHILRVLRYEGLLWRTTQLLKIFSNAVNLDYFLSGLRLLGLRAFYI